MSLSYKFNALIKTRHHLPARDFVEISIRNNEFLAEYFNMDRVHQMLNNHMSGKSNEYGKITALLTLSLWHKLFIEGEGDIEKNTWRNRVAENGGRIKGGVR